MTQAERNIQILKTADSRFIDPAYWDDEEDCWAIDIDGERYYYGREEDR